MSFLANILYATLASFWSLQFITIFSLSFNSSTLSSNYSSGIIKLFGVFFFVSTIPLHSFFDFTFKLKHFYGYISFLCFIAGTFLCPSKFFISNPFTPLIFLYPKCVNILTVSFYFPFSVTNKYSVSFLSTTPIHFLIMS